MMDKEKEINKEHVLCVLQYWETENISPIGTLENQKLEWSTFPR